MSLCFSWCFSSGSISGVGFVSIDCACISLEIDLGIVSTSYTTFDLIFLSRESLFGLQLSEVEFSAPSHIPVSSMVNSVGTKSLALARAGCARFWLTEPPRKAPTLVVFTLALAGRHSVLTERS